ncbi:hypothetical protein BN1317_30146 [Staphylococcus capitis]|nr:hypothetical protein CR01_160145 [Staphylococcus capitis CR01]CQD29748.1 hypothetical protein SCAPIOD70098 [Staphylococcus capitis]CUT95881.1 hypothetical protein BN1317_30146 [Staphylococcus capitis]
MPQLILLTENLSTIRPVNNGTNSPLKLPNEVIITAAMINPYGHESLLNKKNKGFCCFIILPRLKLSYFHFAQSYYKSISTPNNNTLYNLLNYKNDFTLLNILNKKD